MSILRPPTPNFRELFRKASPPDKLSLVLSSCFGVGLAPAARGTFGALAAMPLASAIAQMSTLAGAYVLFFLVLLSIWVSGRSAAALQSKDPGEVVIDEAAGLLVTLFLMPATMPNLWLGFVLFRFFDILKPYPIRRLEKIKGGAGIVLDDLLAGVYANVSTRLVTTIVL